MGIKNLFENVQFERIQIINRIRDFILIFIGILTFAFGLESFLIPNSFIDGGVTGISLLTLALTSIPLPILLVVINIPFVVLGYKQIGKTFAIKSILAIAALAVVVTVIPFPIVTSDKLLVSVFGGFFLGLGIGFTMRGGAVLDGTEVLAVYLTRRVGITIGDVILLFNVLIFSVAAYLLSIETALYSMLAYLSASKTVDFVIVGLEEYTGVTIISEQSERVCNMIIGKMGRGITVYNGKKGYGKRGASINNIDIVYTVITRLEIAKLQSEMDKIDKDAFIVMTAIKDTKGGMIKKRPLH